MPMASSFTTRLGNTIIRHKRAVRPLVFPSSEPENEKLGETKRHLLLRTFLYQMLAHAFAPANSVGSEQYIYWNASNPKRTCAPDAFVKLGVPDEPFEIWRTWLHGAPDLVVEIASKHDRERFTWEEKLERFHEAGVREVIRFDADAAPGERLQAWDRVEEDLVERTVASDDAASIDTDPRWDLVERPVKSDSTQCVTLGLHWVVAPAPDIDAAPRLARDPEGRDLLLSPFEAEREISRALQAELRRRDGEGSPP